MGTHCIVSYALNNNITYFDSFGAEQYDSVMCGYFCIGFIDFMLKGKSLIDLSDLFSPNNFKKNDDIIFNYPKNA